MEERPHVWPTVDHGNRTNHRNLTATLRSIIEPKSAHTTLPACFLSPQARHSSLFMPWLHPNWKPITSYSQQHISIIYEHNLESGLRHAYPDQTQSQKSLTRYAKESNHTSRKATQYSIDLVSLPLHHAIVPGGRSQRPWDVEQPQRFPTFLRENV